MFFFVFFSIKPSTRAVGGAPQTPRMLLSAAQFGPQRRCPWKGGQTQRQTDGKTNRQRDRDRKDIYSVNAGSHIAALVSSKLQQEEGNLAGNGESFGGGVRREGKEGKGRGEPRVHLLFVGLVAVVKYQF